MLRGSVVLGCVLVAHAASAQPVELDVDAECDLAPAVRTAGTFVDVAAAHVRITEHALTATIVLDDGAGHAFGPRVLHAASCEELARSVAVVVAMALPEVADVQDRSAVEAVIAAVPEAQPEAVAPTPIPVSDQLDDAIATRADLAPVQSARAVS